MPTRLARLRSSVRQYRHSLYPRFAETLKALPEVRKAQIRPLLLDDLALKTESQLSLMVKKLRLLEDEMLRTAPIEKASA